MLQVAIKQTFMQDRPLTAAQLAEAFGCFWNAAIGEAHERESYEAMSTATVMAEGMAAVQRRLEEIAQGANPLNTQLELPGL
jgi:Holliday junction resolvasome RuvABC endonuclease subunit